MFLATYIKNCLRVKNLKVTTTYFYASLVTNMLFNKKMNNESLLFLSALAYIIKINYDNKIYCLSS